VTQLSPLSPIWADAHQMQQVLLNLFTNATDAMKARGAGVLTVRSRALAGGVLIEVEDDGPGIPAENLSRVFDPFFTTKGVGEGTGLGLSLSIGIVEAHGGSMQVENVAGAGARFTLQLPVGEGVAVAEPPELGPVGGAARARILVVEDETALRAIVTDILTGLGHEVDEAGSGQAALAHLERNVYDVVTLDLRLPDIDGRVIWRWIGERNPELATRVIFMTGDTMSAETQKFLQDAGRPVLTKPLGIGQIAREVEAILAARPSTPAP
jgi:CheY-like chemotaxis protein/anti-sigma regulatory factor (Ser/Thr protein kinase)